MTDRDPDAPAPSKSYRVLIVDDNEPSAKTLGWTLEMLGHDTKLALSAQSAIEIAREYRPQVILLDIGLPVTNGYELCQLLRQEEALKNSIFIAQTGWEQKEHRQMSQQSGFAHHLVKPIQIETLQRIFEELPPAAD